MRPLSDLTAPTSHELLRADTLQGGLPASTSVVMPHPELDTLHASQDLTGGNVLLTSSPTNAHGFCAKIADFGAARAPSSWPCLHRFPVVQCGICYAHPPCMLPAALMRGSA